MYTPADDRKNSVFHKATELKLTNIFHVLASQKGYCFCADKMRKCEGLCRENLRNADGQTYKDHCGADSAVTNDNVLQLLTSAGARKNQLPPHLLTADLSRGREKTPVQVFNEFDTDKVPEFVYCTKTHFGQDAQVDTSVENMQTCSCGDVCNSEKCECVALSEKVYYNAEGLLSVSVALNNEKCQVPVIYECSDLCGCDVRKCRNRATTKGVSYLMEVHKTREMGWGVRAIETIPKGAYIADYCGEMITNSSCDDREDSYLFELGITNGSKFNYTIDAKRVGGFSRFFNHKCDPNMIAMRVFREHQDFRFPNFAFFAIKDITKGEEIGFDYGEEFWKIKRSYFSCKCGSKKCKWS
ncbi:unnamed protein product [Oikopleura dioica]|uniref:SET domain-containing protein n=1 Tax=Oikopleura dioica TaxID=34765 RepID=E4YF52_OIKDI|nr:unnamed protein product [Oikopleura dioica]